MNSPYATWQQFQRPQGAMPQLPGPQPAAPAPAAPTQPRPPQDLFGGNPFGSQRPMPQTGGMSSWSGGGNGGGFGAMFGRLFSGFGGQQGMPGLGGNVSRPFGIQSPQPNTAPNPWYMGGMPQMPQPQWGQAPQMQAPQPAPEAPLDAGMNQYQPYARSHMAPDLGVMRAYARGGLACKQGY